MKVREYFLHFISVVVGVGSILGAYFKKEIVLSMFPTALKTSSFDTLLAAILAYTLTLMWLVGPALAICGIIKILAIRDAQAKGETAGIE